MVFLLHRFEHRIRGERVDVSDAFSLPFLAGQLGFGLTKRDSKSGRRRGASVVILVASEAKQKAGSELGRGERRDRRAAVSRALVEQLQRFDLVGRRRVKVGRRLLHQWRRPEVAVVGVEVVEVTRGLVVDGDAEPGHRPLGDERRRPAAGGLVNVHRIGDVVLLQRVEVDLLDLEVRRLDLDRLWRRDAG